MENKEQVAPRGLLKDINENAGVIVLILVLLEDKIGIERLFDALLKVPYFNEGFFGSAVRFVFLWALEGAKL